MVPHMTLAVLSLLHGVTPAIGALMPSAMVKHMRDGQAHDATIASIAFATNATKRVRVSSDADQLLAHPSDDPTVRLGYAHVDFPAEALLWRIREQYPTVPGIRGATEPASVRYEMSVVPVLVVLTLALHAWLAKLVDAGQGGVTSDTVAAFTAYGLYVGLALLYQILFRVAETSGVEGLSATSIVGAALVLKLLLSVALYAQEGRDAWSEIVEERDTLLRCAIPGIAYVLSDALRAYCLMNMDMSAFTMVYSLRTVGIAVLWVLVFSQSLSWLKWVALAVMALGNFLHRSVEWSSGGDVVSKEASAFLFELALLSVALACVGSVVNELLLKSRTASINLQNCAMYTWGLLGLCMLGPSEGVSWNPVKWFYLGYIGFAAMLVYALHGIATSRLLKYLGNIWKETAIACNVVFSFVIEVCVFKTQYAAFAVAGVVVVFIGMSMFILDGPARKSADGNPPPAERVGTSEPPQEEQLVGRRESETTQQ